MRTICSLLLLSLIASLPGCDKLHSAAPSRPPLRIAAYYWPGMYWIDIANDLGWFKEAGLNVAIVDTNADYFASFNELVEGHIDVSSLTLFDVMLLNAKGADLVTIATTDQTAGADGIVARPGLESLTALRGKRIGVGQGTYGEYILAIVLAREGIALSDVTRVDMPGEKAAAGLAAGTVDAVVTWEPIVAEAVEKAKGKKVWDSSRIPGVCPAALATRRQLVRERAGDLQKLMQVWKRTTEFIAEKSEVAFAIVARVNKKTPTEVREFASIDRILGPRENKTAFSYAAGFDSLHGAARVMNDFLMKQKVISEPLDSTELLDEQFLNALK
jgi:NitT/TauT family transport system substrate-binding protein